MVLTDGFRLRKVERTIASSGIEILDERSGATRWTLLRDTPTNLVVSSTVVLLVADPGSRGF
jgi:hypothetical protein